MSIPTPDKLRDIAHRCQNWPCEAESDDLDYAAACVRACARIMDVPIPQVSPGDIFGAAKTFGICEMKFIIRDELERAE